MIWALIFIFVESTSNAVDGWYWWVACWGTTIVAMVVFDFDRRFNLIFLINIVSCTCWVFTWVIGVITYILSFWVEKSDSVYAFSGLIHLKSLRRHVDFRKVLIPVILIKGVVTAASLSEICIPVYHIVFTLIGSASVDKRTIMFACWTTCMTLLRICNVRPVKLFVVVPSIEPRANVVDILIRVDHLVELTEVIVKILWHSGSIDFCIWILDLMVGTVAQIERIIEVRTVAATSSWIGAFTRQILCYHTGSRENVNYA